MVQRNKCLNLDETGLEEISQDGTALSEKIMPNGSGIQPNRGSDNVLDGVCGVELVGTLMFQEWLVASV